MVIFIFHFELVLHTGRIKSYQSKQYIDKCIGTVMVRGHHDLEAEILWPI